ncbi:hypothetical protein G7046_g4043 [Stylonectria norvegica]|nr:hypothetical protein G7046_g4043 [Stylonectria norvegica]
MASHPKAPRVKTRFLIISDTHGDEFPAGTEPLDEVDVAIHCGDLTEESKIEEFRSSIRLLKQINAPLKLVIAGNHDFTLDIPMFKKKLGEIRPPLEGDLVKREYGDFGEARKLVDEAADFGIVFLDEGTHTFKLANGALLTVYASPFTPSMSDWGFQYHPQEGHDWSIEEGVDVVITHGPPLGVLDYTDSKQRAGSQSLFEAVARSRPQIHCFGHIHEGWGAKLVSWRDVISDNPSHFTDIDNGKSVTVETLATTRPGKFDTPEIAKNKAERLQLLSARRCCSTSHCRDDKIPLKQGSQTLFVNAAIQGTEDRPFQLPWVVSIDLDKA